MVKITGIEGSLIKADDYASLIKAISNEVDNYEGFNPQIAIVDDRRAIIYHDEITEEVPFADEPWAERVCCECGHYEWGKGCPYKDGHITLKMDACHHFTIEVGGELL